MNTLGGDALAHTMAAMAQENVRLEAPYDCILSSLENFLQRTTAGGIVLVVATLVALGLSSGVGGHCIDQVLEQKLGIQAGSRFAIELTWRRWVNDGLMVLFCLPVVLELKHPA